MNNLIMYDIHSDQFFHLLQGVVLVGFLLRFWNLSIEPSRNNLFIYFDSKRDPNYSSSIYSSSILYKPRYVPSFIDLVEYKNNTQ